ncbi:MAG: tetratricopeptide repeat protein, partial [Myxococcota bacterium]
GRALVRVLPFVLLAGLWCNLGLLAHGDEGFIHPYPGGSFTAALWTIAPVLLAYGKLLLWPLGLAAAYDLPPATGMPPGAVAGAWLAVAFLLAFMAFAARKAGEPRVGIALVWIGAFLLPVLNLVPIGTLLNDRYLYAPLCALGPLAVAGVVAAGRLSGRTLSPRPRAAIGAAGLAAVLVLLTGLSHIRAGVWADEARLWSDAVVHSPGSALARYNLGTLYLERGRDDLAEPHLRAALAADPTLSGPYQNLGTLHLRQGKAGLAMREFDAAIRLSGGSYDLWMNLALAQSAAGLPEKAIASLNAALRALPGEGRPYLAMGLLYEQLGDPAQARDAFKLFLASDDGDESQRNLAKARIGAL